MKIIQLIAALLIISTTSQAQVTKLAEVNLLTEKTYDEDYQEALYVDSDYVYSVRYSYGKKDKATRATSKKRTKKVSIDVFDKKHLKRKKAILVPVERTVEFFIKDEANTLHYFYTVLEEDEAEHTKLYRQSINKDFSLGEEVFISEIPHGEISRRKSFQCLQTPDKSKWVIVSINSHQKQENSSTYILTIDQSLKVIQEKTVILPLPFLRSGYFREENLGGEQRFFGKRYYNELTHKSTYWDRKKHFSSYKKNHIQTDNKGNIYVLSPRIPLKEELFDVEYKNGGTYQLFKIKQDGTFKSIDFFNEKKLTYSISYKALPSGKVNCWGIWANEIDKKTEKQKPRGLRSKNPQRLDGIKYFQLDENLKSIASNSFEITEQQKEKILEVLDKNEYYRSPKQRDKEEDGAVDDFYIVDVLPQADGSNILILEYRDLSLKYRKDIESNLQVSPHIYRYSYGPLLFFKVAKDGTFSSFQKVDKAGFVLNVEMTVTPYYGSYHLEKIDDNYFIRAGYSANAEIVLEKKDSVLSIKEALLKFDKKTEEPYVEIKQEDGTFKKSTLKLGTSDGVNVEILEGVTATDEIKIWNKTSKDDKKKDND